MCQRKHKYLRFDKILSNSQPFIIIILVVGLITINVAFNVGIFYINKIYSTILFDGIPFFESPNIK